LPISIFFAEMLVVTFGTIRIIFVSRGKRLLAPALGFFEITIWLFAIGQIMQNLTNLGCYVAFAGGFTVGNFLGILIESKLAIGNLVVRLITNKNTDELVSKLRRAGYGVTCIDGRGATGPVQIVLTVVARKQLANVLDLIQCFDTRAFYSVDDLQKACQGVFPDSKTAASVLAYDWIRLEHRNSDQPVPVA
jgi:uncharacterized protein YebE (UPF0316 family)